MKAILYLLPISLGLGLCGLLGFFWSVKHRQYDDLEADAFRSLNAPDTPMSEEEKALLNRPENRM